MKVDILEKNNVSKNNNKTRDSSSYNMTKDDGKIDCNTKTSLNEINETHISYQVYVQSLVR